MPTVLVTGANRGLGLEFVRQYAVASWRVLAGCRHTNINDELATFTTTQGESAIPASCAHLSQQAIQALAAYIAEASAQQSLN